MPKDRLIDPVQTRLARGYTPVGFIGMLVFPVVRVDKEGGTIPMFGKELFQNYSTRRAESADRNTKDVASPNKLPYAMEEEELSAGYDKRRVDDAKGVFDLRKNARITAQTGVMMTHELLCAGLATDAAKYPAGHALALSGTDQFDDYDNSSPLTQFRLARKTVRNVTGANPNMAWVDAETYDVLVDHPELKGAFQDTTIKGSLTHEQLMKVMKVKTLHVGETLTRDEEGGDLRPVWGKNLGFAVVPEQYAGDNPSYSELVPYFGYTIGLKKHPKADVWEKEGGKVEFVGYTDLFDVKIVGADSAYLIGNTIS